MILDIAMYAVVGAAIIVATSAVLLGLLVAAIHAGTYFGTLAYLQARFHFKVNYLEEESVNGHAKGKKSA